MSRNPPRGWRHGQRNLPEFVLPPQLTVFQFTLADGADGAAAGSEMATSPSAKSPDSEA